MRKNRVLLLIHSYTRLNGVLNVVESVFPWPQGDAPCPFRCGPVQCMKRFDVLIAVIVPFDQGQALSSHYAKGVFYTGLHSLFQIPSASLVIAGNFASHYNSPVSIQSNPDQGITLTEQNQRPENVFSRKRFPLEARGNSDFHIPKSDRGRFEHTRSDGMLGM